MEESLLYIQRIKAMYQSRTFSKSDRLIADYILAHPTCVASTTAAELGEVTGTSSATVVRFCRKLGFSGLVDLKMSMAYRYANGETSSWTWTEGIMSIRSSRRSSALPKWWQTI